MQNEMMLPVNENNSPLYDISLEAGVLGSMLLESDGLFVASSILKGNKDIFFSTQHKVVFEAICDMQSVGLAVDMVSVAQYLQKNRQLASIGGMRFVASLTERINSAAHVNTHCYYLIQLFARRSLFNISQQSIAKVNNYSSDAFEIIAELYKSLGFVQGVLQMRNAQKIESLYDKAIFNIEQAAKSETHLTGVTSGLNALDILTGGWQPSDLIIIAARPGMGKTSLMLAMAKNAAKAGKPGLFVSLEMSDTQLITKLIATELGYTTSQLIKGIGLSVDEAESIRDRARHLCELTLLIDDTAGISFTELRAKAAKAKQEYGIQWLMIDYLQLVKGDAKGNREQEIASISRGLKLLAKELNIPVLAAAQLSRAAENRGGESIPRLSDLRESGSIEMDADVVMFPYRPEYYKITEDEFGNSTADITQLIIAKHRNGPTDTVAVRSIMRLGGVYKDLEENGPFEVQQPRLPAPTGYHTPSPFPKSNFDNEPAF